jgi:long-chain fatty acid transport protein
MQCHCRSTAGGKRQKVMSVTRFTAAAVSTVATLSTTSLADGFRNPPESASGIGTVGARYTMVQDASAMAFNPANLAAVDQPSGQASLTWLHSETEFRSLLGTAETIDNGHWLPAVYVAVPLEGSRYTVGLGINAPFGQSTTWERNGVFRYTAPYFAEVRVLNCNPTLAMKLTDNVSLGIGANIFYSDLDFRQVGAWSMMPGVDPAAADGELQMDADGWGLGANIGVAWHIGGRHSLAASYRSPVEVEYEGHLNLTTVPMPLAMILSTSSDLETDITFPGIAAVGYGCEVTDRLRIGADVEWIAFSQFDSLDVEAGSNAMLVDMLGISSTRSDWDDTWTAGVGAEWDCNNQWTVLAGYIFMESPIPDETLSPTLPGGDQQAGTLGLRRQADHGVLTLAYGYVHNKDRDISNNQNMAYNGSYDNEATQVLSVSYVRVF